MQPSPPATTTVQFRGLDVLRCCAALAIVLYHSTLNSDYFFPAVAKLLHNLPIGVDFFFLISGFLITYLLLAEKERAGTISLRRFYIRRALRIFPLYYAIIALAWWLHPDSQVAVNYKAFALFAGNFWMIRHDWTVATLNPLWSLCIEEQFYLVIPLLVWLIPTRRLGWLFGAIVLISVVFRAYSSVTVEYNWMTTYCHTFSRCDVLAVGGWLAWHHFTRPIRLQSPRWALWATLGYLGLLMTIIDTSDVTTFGFAVFKKYLHILPLVVVFCLVLFNQVVSHRPVQVVERVANYLGKVSYGIYMFHSPLIFWLDKHPAFYADNRVLRVGVIMLLTIAVASLSYELFEKQILRLKKRFEVIRTARA